MTEATKLLFRKFLSLKNAVRYAWKESRLRVLGTLLFIILAISGVYFALWQGLNFIVSLGGLGVIILKRVVFVLFFILFFMVAVSFGVLFYGTAFKSRETEFLLNMPVRRRDIIFYKFMEAFILSVLIPVLVFLFFFTAYAHVGKIGMALPVVSVFYTLPFLLISCFLGYMAAILVVRFLNLKKFLIGLAAVVVLLLLMHTRHVKLYQSKGFFYFLSEDVAFLVISKTWFLPFSWAGYGLTYFEDWDFKKSFLYLLNLWSLSCLCLSFIPATRRMFMRGYQRRFLTEHKKLVVRDYLTAIISRMKMIPVYMRAFIIKDTKIFVREPSLWLQILIFFGILFFYFLNYRKFSFQDLEPVWKNAVTFLNIFSILSIVAGMSIRFVFPQWSLEGRNFWILKLSPVSLRKVFLEKFIISFFVLFFLSELLIFTCSYMLELKNVFFYLPVFIVAVSSVTLISLSLGLGAYFADFKQEYYLKAVESLGGFIATVVNFGYAFITVFMFGAIAHLYFIKKLYDFEGVLATASITWALLSLALSFFVSRLGIRKLESKEY